MSNVQEFLSTVAAFKDLSPEELEQLSSHAATLNYESGDTIVKQDDPATECFVVSAGSAAVWSGSPSDPSSKTVKTLRAGDLFGEIALIAGFTRSATVTAIEPTECLVFPATAVQDLLGRDHGFSLRILQMAVTRLAELERSAS